MVRDHGFGCVPQMQGQMHVHVTEMDLPVPLVGQFFRPLRLFFTPLGGRFRAVPCMILCVSFGSIPFP
ncbi:hypothetical protein EF913_09810 [Streptomyces sp. WAC04189]|nr:hypothetical protein AUW26_15395 [Streptomyces sp. CC71]NUV94540.1 hypothetical protein [Streptomyces sp. KAI 90]PVD03198.1 hypothetical protein DBP22_29040 [Streptomyces sp. CS207]QCB23810.1 hypothetical protein E5N77_19895 [Streptomyces sp. SS52]QCR48734.1 hypothetical protein C1N79_20095 [Streptomyces sp. SGAir0924]RSS03729.1 hypothetical protein EF913_09810 [Streptomyces sp. WAC04189]RSS27181.1 hypothetical protein EF914_02585 [Streptomyces sp. WAC05458]RSS61412.1 hypothetical protein